MKIQKKDLPLGVVVENAFDLEFYLPYRIHLLALRVGFVGEGTGGKAFDVNSADDELLRVREWRLLLLLASLGPMSSSEIADRSKMEKATVTRATKELRNQGLITAKASKSDGRKSYITLTQKGAELYDKLAEQRQRQVNAIESCLSKSEIETFYKILNKLDDHLMEQIQKSQATESDWD